MCFWCPTDCLKNPINLEKMYLFIYLLPPADKVRGVLWCLLSYETEG